MIFVNLRNHSGLVNLLKHALDALVTVFHDFLEGVPERKAISTDAVDPQMPPSLVHFCEFFGY